MSAFKKWIYIHVQPDILDEYTGGLEWPVPVEQDAQGGVVNVQIEHAHEKREDVCPVVSAWPFFVGHEAFEQHEPFASCAGFFESPQHPNPAQPVGAEVPL